MINFEDCLAAVALAIGEPVTETEIAESLVAQRLNSIIADLDELCVMAKDAKTAALLEREKKTVGLIHTRSATLMALVLAQSPAGLRIVR